MKNLFRSFIFAAFFACIFPAVLSSLAPSLVVVHAQDLDDVTFSGRVIDQNGALIPGATVTAVLVETGLERTVTADDAGRYRIIELNPGVYTLRATATGFATIEKTELTTIAGQNVQIDFTLNPAGVIAEQTTVSEADVPLVDTTRTVVGGTVTTQEIEDLPNTSRSPLDLIFTLGGVTEEPLSTRDLAEDRGTNPNSTIEETGTFALAGGPAYSNNITIDGLDNNDDRAARERFQPSIEAVEEVQIITNQFSAEYGRASGGRINIRTRGGSNKYRGRGFYFFRNDILNANTSNNQARGLTRLPLEQHNPGFTFSGPVKLPFYDGRKRTFFFSSYEYDTILDSAFVNTLVPVLTNPLFPLPAPTNPGAAQDEDAPTGSEVTQVAPFVEGLSTPVKNHTFTTRIDHRFNDLHNGSLLYQLGRQKNLRQFGGGNRLAETLIGRTRNTDAISYTDNYVFSAQLVNQLRFQISRLTPAIAAGGGNTTPVVLIDIDPSQPSLDTQQRSNPLIAGTSTSGATDRRESRIQFQDAVSYVVGPHSLKFGGDFQRIRSTFIDLSDASGTFDFDSAGDFIANRPSRFRQNFETESTQNNTYTGFFVQDEWRLKPNLTMSMGLRYENESILRDRNNFGPRFALAYDPFRSGKTVLRLGAGIFYNRALLRTIDDFTLGSQQLFLDTDDIPVDQRQDVLNQIRFPQPLTADSTLVRQFGTLNTGFSRRLDPSLRIPESYQVNAGFEREIGRRYVIEANYTYNRGIHLWREFNVNAPQLPAGFSSLTAFLLSRDFPNFRACPTCARPLFNRSDAGELVRFQLNSGVADPNNIGRVVEFGVPISLISLNSINSTNALNAAIGALNSLRPDPTRTDIQQLASIGNSFYHGLTIELRSRFRRSKTGLSYSFRAAYTLSRLIDDGIVNTSDALTVGDFRAERSRSLLDRRHRFVFSGTLETPPYLGKLRISPIVRITSGAPFNISIGGSDRNLDDVGNDRPIFTGDTDLLRFRSPGEPLNPQLLTLFSLPTIGQTGNLPRNAGIGPGQFLFDINITREFRINEKMRVRPTVEIDNVLNKTVFSFGTEFINFNGLSPTATPAQRQAFLDTFLVPTRTLRPRQIRLGVRFDF